MILCRLLHELCYSLRSLKLGTRPWYSTGPDPILFTDHSLMTCAMKVNSRNSKKYLITFYIVSWVINWSIIPSTTLLHQIIFKMLSKITGLPNIGHWPIPYIFDEVNLCVTLMHYPKYDVYPSNNLGDIKQYHWTTIYRSVTYIHFMRSIFVILIQ